jgi:malonyl CoA-acyl carrier protein transacylase
MVGHPNGQQDGGQAIHQTSRLPQQTPSPKQIQIEVTNRYHGNVIAGGARDVLKVEIKLEQLVTNRKTANPNKRVIAPIHLAIAHKANDGWYHNCKTQQKALYVNRLHTY